MKSIADILKNFNPREDRYVSREFQTFGVFLSEKLGDPRRKALYIKYAKEIPRPILEEAYRFVVDANARNKGALFMWKLRDLGVFEKFKLEPPKRKKNVPIPNKVRSGLARENPPKRRSRKHRDLEDELF
ncbi:MAG: hypothetical protein N2691_02850 [Patescibacteria group bacterium]|nr:hypothetical protein [Patescibacteria group bacterium]